MKKFSGIVEAVTKSGKTHIWEKTELTFQFQIKVKRNFLDKSPSKTHFRTVSLILSSKFNKQERFQELDPF